MKAIQLQLLATKVKDMDPDVPVEIQRQVRALKEALVQTVDVYMRCQAKNEMKAKVLQAELAQILGGKAGVNTPAPTEQYNPADKSDTHDQIYGADLNITVTRPAKLPQLVAVQLGFGVECGDDNMLLIYERDKAAWHRSLRWQSGDYKEISGAFGDFFQYAVMPGNGPGSWSVAVAHGWPWCTSNWSAFDLDVIEPAHGAVSQRVSFHKEDGYWREADPVLKAKADGFELRLEKECLDGGLLMRSGIYRYQLVGDQVRRTQPVAKNGRDFVDEWLQTEWSDAAHWSDAGRLKNLEQEHARLVQLRKAERPLLSYGPVRGCSGDARLFSVELDLDLDPGSPSYFLIQQGENSFTLRQVSSTSFPNCHGPNLMPVQ